MLNHKWKLSIKHFTWYHGGDFSTDGIRPRPFFVCLLRSKLLLSVPFCMSLFLLDLFMSLMTKINSFILLTYMALWFLRFTSFFLDVVFFVSSALDCWIRINVQKSMYVWHLQVSKLKFWDAFFVQKQKQILLTKPGS